MSEREPKARRAGAIARAFDALWLRAEPAYPLAAFRIAFGSYLLAYFGSLAPHVELLFSAQGVYVPYLVPDPAPSPLMAAGLFGLLWLGCLAFTLGLWTRTAIVVVLALYGYHYFLALGVKHSTFERLIALYLLALLPGRPGAVWSIDAHRARRRGRPLATTSASFSARILRFQTIVLYLGAGLWKLGNPAWHEPYLLKSTLQSIWATPLGFRIVQLGWTDATWTRLSLGVAAGELLLAGLLLWRPARLFGVALGAGFHLFNVLVLYLPEFLVCLTPYVLFLPAPLVERAGRAVARRVSPRSRASA